MKDYHVHTYYSDDSIYPMKAVLADCAARGLDEVCFTDHVDYGIKKDWTEENVDPVFSNVDYPRYFDEIDECRKLFPDITIKAGLEFGAQMITLDKYRELIKRYGNRLDFVLLSVHQVGNKEFWNQEFQKGKSQLEYNRGYYEELLRLVRSFKDYSVLAHLDLIVRYDRQGTLPFEDVKDVITEILKQVIADGKGIEVNTSSVRYQVGDLTPSVEILKLYHELGGRVLTFGSDSHKPEHLGAHITEQMAQVKELGFTEYCTFSHGKPEFHPL